MQRNCMCLAVTESPRVSGHLDQCTGLFFELLDLTVLYVRYYYITGVYFVESFVTGQLG